MSRTRRLLVIAIASIALSVAAALLYLSISDLSGWRDAVARLVTDAIGRELGIDGDFAVDLGLVTRVRASGVKLANADGSPEPVMASVERLDAEIDLWSLVRGPLHLRTVEIEGGKAIFETAPDGRSNWALGRRNRRTGDRRPFELRIDRIRAAGIELRFVSAGGSQLLDVSVDSLSSEGDPAGMHRLELRGGIAGRALNVSGRLGTLTGLVNADRVEHDLTVTFHDSELVSRGVIGDLATLSALELAATARVPDLDAVAAPLGLPATGAGALSFDLDADSVAALTWFTATLTGDSVTARATGTVDSLISPGDLELELVASGPDIGPLAAVGGVAGLPADAFEIAGRLRWRGFPIEVTGLEARVGDNRLTADGALGAPPAMLGTDLRFQSNGPNIAALGPLLGLALPSERFDLDGRIVRVGNGIRLEAVELGIGRSSLSATGFVGDPPGYAGTDLEVSADGPDLSAFGGLAGVELPADAFEIAGRLTEGGNAIALSGVRAKVGGISASVDGRLTTEAGLLGSSLEVVVDGADLAELGPALGLRALPSEPFHIAGAVGFEAAGVRFHHVETRLAGLELVADGLLSRTAGLAGSTLRGELRGPRLDALSPLLPGRPLPGEPFRVAGELEVLARGYGLHGIDLELSSARGRVDGTLGAPPELDGTRLTVELAGPSLAVAGAAFPGIALPAAPFAIEADVGVGRGEVRIARGSVTLDSNRATLAGTVVPGNGLVGSTVDVTVEGSDLGAAARMVSATVGADWPELPGLAYTLSGAIAVDDAGYRLEPLTSTLGRARAEITGRVGRWPDLAGSDLDLDIGGPDASILRSMSPVDLPVAPFRAVGRLSTTDSGYGFERFRLSIGDVTLVLDGTAGSFPRLIGTDLDLALDGPDLSIIGGLAGIRGLPALPVHLSGRFEGDPHRFTGTGVRAGLGSSDVDGSFQIDLRDRPAATCSLRSTAIDAAELLPAPPSAPDAPKPERTGKRLLIPDEPIDLSVLEAFDLELDWTVGSLATRLNRFHDVRIGLTVADGRIELDRFEGRGSSGGTLAAAAMLAPDPAGYRLDAHLRLDRGKVNLAGPGAEPSRFTPVDVELDIRAAGRTPHQLAASSGGTVTVVAEQGVLAQSVVDLVAADIVVALLEKLNPFAKSEDTTKLECAVIMASLENGLLELDPVAIQTDRVTILGGGTVDLGTEAIKLDWVTKPRKGFGISASAITNSYVRIGGTLAQPSLEAKPVEALATTGVAVATAGISILAKGLLDRVTADKKVCETALREIDARRGVAEKR